MRKKNIYPSLGLLGLAGAIFVVWNLYFKTKDGYRSSKKAGIESSAPANMRDFKRKNRIQAVSFDVIQQKDMPIRVEAVGSLSPSKTAIVRTQANGILKNILFTEGQMVQAGQILAHIDARTFETNLEQAKGAWLRDSAQLSNAKLDAERYRQLFAQDAIAKQQLDTQLALVRQLEGTVALGAASVKNAQLQLSYTQVRAPIAGRIGFKQVDVGNLVQTSDANGIANITQTQAMSLIFSIPSRHIPLMQTQWHAKKTMPVYIKDAQGQLTLAQGHVASMDNSIDISTDTIKVKAILNNPRNDLFPNQTVQVVLELDTLPHALLVPQASILKNTKGAAAADGFFVYKIHDNDTVSMHPIQSKLVANDWVAVDSLDHSLQAGDKVVTDGVDGLRDGAKVEWRTRPDKKDSAKSAHQS